MLFSKREKKKAIKDMKNKRWLILIIIGFLLIPVNVFVPDASSETWENEYGKLEVWPDVATGIITQVQYCDLTSYVDDAEIDVTFRFDLPVGNPDIWMWRNISHWVRVPDYGMINSNYTLVNISNIIVIDEPEYVDFGDIPSDFYRQGTASYFTGDPDGEWWNRTFDIGFDSFEWLNPEHTEAKFYYEYYGIVGYHMEEQFWFDWDNIKNLFTHVEHNGKHYYYVRSWMIKDQLYQFKWQYDVPLGSDGKWDLMAKLSSDPLGTWRVIIDPYWDSDWGYYKTIEVADKIDDYQMKILIDYDDDVGGNVSCEGHANANFSDLRFVYDNTTELPYWIENTTASIQSTFWVNNSGNYSSFEMFYGNAVAVSNSDGYTTFDWFDDFENYAEGSDIAGQGGWVKVGGDAADDIEADTFEGSIRCHGDMDVITTSERWNNSIGNMPSTDFKLGYDVRVTSVTVDNVGPIGIRDKVVFL